MSSWGPRRHPLASNNWPTLSFGDSSWMLPALTSMRLVVFGPTRPLILILQKTPNNKVREEGGGLQKQGRLNGLISKSIFSLRMTESRKKDRTCQRFLQTPLSSSPWSWTKMIHIFLWPCINSSTFPSNHKSSKINKIHS